MVQNGTNVPKWCKMVQMYQNSAKWYKCTKMYKMVKKDKKLSKKAKKWSQNGLECAIVSKLSGPTENRTRTTSLQDKCASHYTIGPLK